jgi:hypothetical protein
MASHCVPGGHDPPTTPRVSQIGDSAHRGRRRSARFFTFVVPAAAKREEVRFARPAGNVSPNSSSVPSFRPAAALCDVVPHPRGTVLRGNRYNDRFLTFVAL